MTRACVRQIAFTALLYIIHIRMDVGRIHNALPNDLFIREVELCSLVFCLASRMVLLVVAKAGSGMGMSEFAAEREKDSNTLVLGLIDQCNMSLHRGGVLAGKALISTRPTISLRLDCIAFRMWHIKK